MIPVFPNKIVTKNFTSNFPLIYWWLHSVPHLLIHSLLLVVAIAITSAWCTGINWGEWAAKFHVLACTNTKRKIMHGELTCSNCSQVMCNIALWCWLMMMVLWAGSADDACRRLNYVYWATSGVDWFPMGYSRQVHSAGWCLWGGQGVEVLRQYLRKIVQRDGGTRKDVGGIIEGKWHECIMVDKMVVYGCDATVLFLSLEQ